MNNDEKRSLIEIVCDSNKLDQKIKEAYDRIERLEYKVLELENKNKSNKINQTCSWF